MLVSNYRRTLAEYLHPLSFANSDWGKPTSPLSLTHRSVILAHPSIIELASYLDKLGENQGDAELSENNESKLNAWGKEELAEALGRILLPLTEPKGAWNSTGTQDTLSDPSTPPK